MALQFSVSLSATLAFGVSWFSTTAYSQAVPTMQLSVPEARLEKPFSRVGGIRELPNRRVIVLDLGDQGVVVVDERLQDTKPVGRQGNGPGEYNRPTKLFSLPNGEAAIQDWGNTRLLAVGANGTPAGLLPANARCATTPVSYPLFAGVDQEGRFYSEGASARLPGSPASDSTAIIRWRTPCAGDTLALFRTNVPPRDVTAFRSLTQWAVSDGGSIAILHPDPYRVTLIAADGRRTEGLAIRYEPIRMTDAIKAQWREEQQVPMGVSTIYRDGRVSGGVMKKPYREPDNWPAVLPPFLQGAATFDNEGNLWVKRTVKPGELPSYDVINADGKVSARVQLRANSRVVGFGKGKVYVISRDDDDLEFLERHPLRTLR